MLINFVSDPVCMWLFITVGRWSVLFQILYACGCSSQSVAGQFCFRSCMLVAVHLGRSLVNFVSDPVCLWLFISVGRWSVLFQILYACGCSSRSVAPLICPSEMAECYRFLTYLVITCLSACPFACLLLYSHIHSFNYLPVHLHTSLPAYLPTYLLNYLRN